MSAVISIATGERLRIFFLRHPEWWVWSLSVSAWALLFIDFFRTSSGVNDPGSIFYCMPGLTIRSVAPTGNPAHEISLFVTISNSLFHWIIMIVAMMFPLLKDPIRHVAFSVSRGDRVAAIMTFLFGYMIIWAAIGLLFLMLSFLLTNMITEETPLLTSLVRISGFVLAAILAWRPARRTLMMRSWQTIPIRILGAGMHRDSLAYGLKMGWNCIKMCWAPMAGLLLINHHIILMSLVTLILIAERYCLPHRSRIPGFAWAVIALTLLT